MNVDALGNPLRFIPTGGQDHDITQAHELIAGYQSAYVIADQGYDAGNPIPFQPEGTTRI